MTHETLPIPVPEDHPVTFERSTSYVQDVSFLSLTRVDGFASGMRVLDVGCGTGDMYAFFEKAGYKVLYTGIDANEELLTTARSRFPTANFAKHDVHVPLTERYDYIFCNGLPTDDTDVTELITGLYAQCDVALACRVKSAHSRAANPHLQATSGISYEWPSHVLEHCKTLSAYVALDHASDSTAFSIFIYRKNRGALQRFVDFVKPTAKYDRASRAVIDYCIELELWEELRTFLGTLEPCPAVSFFMGQAFDALGEFTNAETSFRAASVDVPDMPWPHVGLAYHYSRLKQIDQAIAAAGAAIEVAPVEEAAHECLVRVLLASNRTDEAQAAAAAMAPSALGYYLRGVVAESPATTLGEVERALEVAPEYVPALVLKAETLDKLERPDEANAVRAHVETLTHA